MLRRALVLGGLLALSPTLSQAAVMMMVEGIIGPSRTAGYSGWFNLNSISWSIDRAKPEGHDLVATMESAAAVATLIQFSATNTVLKKVVFDSAHIVSGADAFVIDSRVTCEEAVIRSSGIAGHSDDRAIVELRFRCGRLAWETYDYGSGTKTVTASGKGSWNFKTNTPQ